MEGGMLCVDGDRKAKSRVLCSDKQQSLWQSQAIPETNESNWTGDTLVCFSCHVIYDVWRNKETNSKFSFWVDIKWKSRNLCWVQLFQRLPFCRLQPPVLPGALAPIHYCGQKYFGEAKRFDRVQLVMLGVSSTKQVDSLLPRYACKGITYLWRTDLLDTRTFLNMNESIPKV